MNLKAFTVEKPIHENLHGILEMDVISIRPDFRKMEIVNNFLSIGIDPGTVNFGVCVIEPYCQKIKVFQIRLKRGGDIVKRILNTEIILDCTIQWNSENFINPHFIVESSSFALPYRQVELAEVRTACVKWAMMKRFPEGNIQIVPPTKIKKAIFGDTKLKAHEFWDDLAAFPDAAAALSMALYPCLP